MSQTASVAALEPVQDPDAVPKMRDWPWTVILGRRLSDKLALCQLRVAFRQRWKSFYIGWPPVLPDHETTLTEL